MQYKRYPAPPLTNFLFGGGIKKKGLNISGKTGCMVVNKRTAQQVNYKIEIPEFFKKCQTLNV